MNSVYTGSYLQGITETSIMVTDSRYMATERINKFQYLSS